MIYVIFDKIEHLHADTIPIQNIFDRRISRLEKGKKCGGKLK
jgi:hypothetical protein